MSAARLAHPEDQIIALQRENAHLRAIVEIAATMRKAQRDCRRKNGVNYQIAVRAAEKRMDIELEAFNRLYQPSLHLDINQ